MIKKEYKQNSNKSMKNEVKTERDKRGAQKRKSVKNEVKNHQQFISILKLWRDYTTFFSLINV